MPFINPEKAMLAYGFSPRVAASREAIPVMIANTARSTAAGLGVLALYFQGYYRSVDTVVAALAYGLVVDTWLVARENVRMGWVKGVTGVFCGVWGVMGLTIRFAR